MLNYTDKEIVDFHPDGKAGSKWHEIKFTQTISTNVPLDTALTRLSNAFTSIIKISKGFLSRSYKYKGAITDNNLDIVFTIDGDSLRKYHIKGKVFQDYKGSCVEFTTTINKTPLIYLLLSLFALFLIPFKHFLEIFFPNLNFPYEIFTDKITIMAITCVLITGNFLILRWQCREASDKVADVIINIINGANLKK
jgi:hypothetical protein